MRFFVSSNRLKIKEYEREQEFEEIKDFKELKDLNGIDGSLPLCRLFRRRQPPEWDR
ncbi:hypothetical protein FACS189432_01900 [Bacteroidia bacterium]|nr:hypothetical protein FACS189432_01900 [Bacteroidia bacterium]